jgi:hypothetical protein
MGPSWIPRRVFLPALWLSELLCGCLESGYFHILFQLAAISRGNVKSAGPRPQQANMHNISRPRILYSNDISHHQFKQNDHPSTASRRECANDIPVLFKAIYHIDPGWSDHCRLQSFSWLCLSIRGLPPPRFQSTGRSDHPIVPTLLALTRDRL